MVLALVAVAAVVITVVGCSSAKDDGKSGTAKVGDCVVRGATADAKTETVDCSSEKAVYKIAQTSDKKLDCATDYTAYQANFADGGTAFLCLAPNFKQGSCYSESSSAGVKNVDCGSSEANFKVVKRIDGQADELLCGADADSFRLISEAPKTTFCLAKPKA